VKLRNFRSKFPSRFVGTSIIQSQNFVFNFALKVLMGVLLDSLPATLRDITLILYFAV